MNPNYLTAPCLSHVAYDITDVSYGSDFLHMSHNGCISTILCPAIYLQNLEAIALAGQETYINLNLH